MQMIFWNTSLFKHIKKPEQLMLKKFFSGFWKIKFFFFQFFITQKICAQPLIYFPKPWCKKKNLLLLSTCSCMSRLLSWRAPVRGPLEWQKQCNGSSHSLLTKISRMYLVVHLQSLTFKIMLSHLWNGLTSSRNPIMPQLPIKYHIISFVMDRYDYQSSCSFGPSSGSLLTQWNHPWTDLWNHIAISPLLN